MDQIYASLYNEFKMNKRYFKDYIIFSLVNDMRDTCDEIYRKQYKQLRKLLIPLCSESHDRYYFNILRVIVLLYHLYIDHEIYEMSYNKKQSS